MVRSYPSILERKLAEGVGRKLFPGGIACLMTQDGQPLTVCHGRLGDAKENYDLPVRPDTVYDLASLTKVVVTLPLVLWAVQSGELKLSDPAARYIPEFGSGRDGERKRQITVFHLLTHTSGLPAWRPYFVRLRGRQAYIAAISAEPLAADPGQRIIYSDLGFMLLGFLLERLWNQPLDQLAGRMLFGPLEMRRTAYRPSERFTENMAPTEKGNDCEYGMASDYAGKYEAGEWPEGSFALNKADLAGLDWRRDVICGSVHDANAYYGLEGVSGHAGLFADVADLQNYMRIWRSPSLLSGKLIRLATRPHVRTGQSIRGLGWELDEDGSFGHTGFTGTMIWHSPRHRLTLIVLTNRVHPAVRQNLADWRISLRQAILSACE